MIIESQHDKTNKMTCAPSEDTDQPGQPPSLIRVFTVRMKKPWVLSCPMSAQRMPRLIWIFAGGTGHFVCFAGSYCIDNSLEEMCKLFSACTEQISFPYITHITSMLTNLTPQEREILFDHDQDYLVITQSKRARESLLTQCWLKCIPKAKKKKKNMCVLGFPTLPRFLPRSWTFYCGQNIGKYEGCPESS